MKKFEKGCIYFYIASMNKGHKPHTFIDADRLMEREAPEKALMMVVVRWRRYVRQEERWVLI
jgi:hypothetical protein